jgi:hypothetical protein
MRHGASMMGPDYTHWHGGYEVSKHFYTEFLPLVRELAEKKGDEELSGLIAEELSRPEHQWLDGQDRAEADRVRAHYKSYFGMPRPGE